jgi:hypothetical protein
MLGTTQDITDRKRVEEDRQALSNALQHSNARLEEAQRYSRHLGQPPVAAKDGALGRHECRTLIHTLSQNAERLVRTL